MTRQRAATLAGVIALLAALGLAAWGVYRGEIGVVYSRAVFVCMECVGIG